MKGVHPSLHGLRVQASMPAHLRMNGALLSPCITLLCSGMDASVGEEDKKTSSGKLSFPEDAWPGVRHSDSLKSLPAVAVSVLVAAWA